MPKIEHAARDTQHLPYTHPNVISRFENDTACETILVAVKKYVRPGGSILDVGSGRGELMELLAASGYSVYGCDLDDECLKLSRRFGFATKVDIENISADTFDQQFDCIIISHVLEHLADPRETLKRLAMFSKGLMIVAVPNPSYLLFVFRSLMRIKIDYVNVRHLYSWDWYHFRTFIELGCGMKILEFCHDSVALPVTVPVRGWLYNRGLLGPIENRFLKALLPRFCRSITAVIQTRPE
ncbi:MAG: class I SAM-dependent methyltransferase [Thermoleophilia bacterium]